MESTAQRYPPASQPDADPPASPPQRRRLRRAAIAAGILAGLVCLYALLGFIVLPLYLETKIPETVSARLGLPVTVQDVRLNPFTLALTIRGFDISEADQSPLIGFDELLVNLSLSSVVDRAWTFDQIRMQVPYARIVIDEDGALNLRALQRQQTPAPSSPASADRDAGGSTIPAVIIRSLTVENGAVEFHDQSRATPYTLDIVPIWFALKNFRTLRAQDNAFAFGAELDQGEDLTWQGRLLLNPLRVEGRVTVAGIKLRGLWEYVRDTVNFEIRDGTVHAESSYSIESTPEGLQVKSSEGSIGLDNLAIFEKGTDRRLLALPAFSIRGLGADLQDRRISMASLETQGAAMHAVIEKDGQIDLRRFFTIAGARPTPASSQRSAAPPWTVLVEKVVIDDYRATIEDRRPPQPVHLDLSKLHVDLEHAAYPGTTPVRLAASVSVNETGTLRTAGDVTLTPLAADLKVEAAQIPLATFQPYVGEIAHIEIKGGAANTSGHVEYAAGETPSLRFQGDASVTALKTVDAHLKKDFVNWDSLAVNSIDARLPAGGITIAEVLARRPYADIIIAEDRSINLKTVLKKQEDASAPAADKQKAGRSSAMVTKVGAVRIIDGSAHFADFSIHPQVDTGIYRLNGSIRGLSSNEVARAKVALHGEVDKYAPVTVAGTINPLSSEAFTDLHVSFKNVNLTTLSPYSTKFAGYPIEKGKLSMELDYRLAHQQLEAQNDVVIDHLTLGKKVESPDATSLPVKLVVALLKDRHGRINVDLPVRGDLNDPEFHYGKLLWNVVVNLFQKAAASPFALLGKLAGGSGEELNQIRFQVGRAELPSDSEQKLNALAKSLEERPALQLEVTGTADPVADRAALREAKLEQQLASVKQAQASGPNGRTRSLQTSMDEDAHAMQALYARTFGALPEGVKNGRNASVTTEDLRARLLESITINDDDLRRLAQERAGQIQDFLVHRAAVPAERVYLVGARIDGRAQNELVETTLQLTAG